VEVPAREPAAPEPQPVSSPPLSDQFQHKIAILINMVMQGLPRTYPDEPFLKDGVRIRFVRLPEQGALTQPPACIAFEAAKPVIEGVDREPPRAWAAMPIDAMNVLPTQECRPGAAAALARLAGLSA
jgi:hypothetical protein